MRALLLSLLLLSVAPVRAEPAAGEELLPLFELAGIHLLCEQSAPLLLRGQALDQQAYLSELFASETFCLELARRVAAKFEPELLEQARKRLQSDLAQRFTEAERTVGEQPEGLTEYRQRLAEQPPRGARLELVQRLDRAAHTTALASLLRYEVGKTQALLALKARGENLDEDELQAQTQKQFEAIRQSSAQAVESFMLYAYRQVPSKQLTEYARLYEHASVGRLLAVSLEMVPQLFAERRELIRQAAAREALPQPRSQ